LISDLITRPMVGGQTAPVALVDGQTRYSDLVGNLVGNLVDGTLNCSFLSFLVGLMSNSWSTSA